MILQMGVAVAFILILGLMLVLSANLIHYVVPVNEQQQKGFDMITGAKRPRKRICW